MAAWLVWAQGFGPISDTSPLFLLLPKLQLATWFRRKYPDLVDGVIAASAPIWSFVNMTPPYDYAGKEKAREWVNPTLPLNTLPPSQALPKS